MPAVPGNVVGYGTFEYTDKGTSEANWVATGPDLASIKGAIERFHSPSESGERPAPREEVVDVESEVGRGIWSFYKKLKSYYEISASTEIVPRAFVNAFFKQQIQEYAKKNFDVVDEHLGASIYGLSEIDLSYANRQIDRWNSISEGFDKLPASVLLSLVAGFDSAFADFAKVLLKSKPERYSGSDRQYSISEIMKLESLEQLIIKAADDEIDQLMNKSHADQVGFFEKSFDISIKNHYERWPQFIEIFERRNLAAHGSLKVNERYLENCKKAGNSTLPAVGINYQ